MAKRKGSSSFNLIWFEQKLANSGLSQRGLADAMGLDPAAIVMIKRGERKLQIDEVVLLAGLFNCPVEEVLNNAGASGGGAKAKGNMTVQIVGKIDSELNITKIEGGPRVPKIDGLSVLRFETAGSAFDGLDGGLVYYRESNGEHPDSECLGRYCVVRYSIGDKKHHVMRVVKRGYEPGRFNLHRLSGPKIEENVVLEWCSPVVWMKF